MQTGNQVYKQSARLMGNHFEFSVVGNDPFLAEQQMNLAIEEIRRIEKLLTTFSNHSQTNLINENAGIMPVEVDLEIIDLIQRSLKISVLTQGAFDISYGSVDKCFWNFDTTMTSLPDPGLAKESVKLINYRHILVNREKRTVFLQDKGMRIGFGGIGKGYAADRAKMILKQIGVEAGIVNASGDLSTWGTQPGGNPWTVGIASPDCKYEPFSFLNISDMSVATSGDYEKFAIIKGKRYSHTIDPKTGFPASGIKSVTMIAPFAEIADAMTTPIMVMGITRGLNLVNQMKQIACIIIDDHNRLHTSGNIHLQK